MAIEGVMRLEANLYAAAHAPNIVLVEIRCGQTVLTARAAYGLGRVLVSLGRAANGTGAPS